MRKPISPVARFTQIAIEHQAWVRARQIEGAAKGGAERVRRERERKAIARAKRMEARRAANKRLSAPKVAGLAGWKVMLARMQTGAWYGLPDLVELMPEYPRCSVKAYLYQKAPGFLERAENPEFDHGRHSGRQGEPRFLFRLSPGGEKKAAEWYQRLSRWSDSGEGV